MKKDEDDLAPSGLVLSKDKAVVLQEARVFNEYPVIPKKCRLVLARIVYLLYQGQTLTEKEATDTFFSITKLFQNPDQSLRQMVYLVIKELSTLSNDVIMVTSSITKDMAARGDLIYKPNAIRALVKITHPSMIQGIERFIKQSIVDKNAAVASAAIVSAMHLWSVNKDVVKRWTNEVQEATSSRGLATQYHAIGLLYQIRQHDRMAIVKLIQTFSRSLRSPYAHCLLIRYTAKCIYEEGGWTQLANQLWTLLTEWMTNQRSEMVVFEAARCICCLPNLTPSQIKPAVSVLQLHICNHKPVVKFAAIRALNDLALTQPEIVASCNVDMEGLITDPNRSVATYAITTLLKTGNEASVDRLMKQITGFMNEIADEFKIIIVEAVRSLCLKFPSKQFQMMTFLATGLRDEGGYELKGTIVDAIFDIVNKIPESKEMGTSLKTYILALAHLCEFIEDCEYTKLSVRILHLLGSHGPSVASNPSRYIRFIYNRVILENSTIRAAAVAALAQFAVAIEDLRPRIKILLNRCLEDQDDEVRDRAALYLAILESPTLQANYIENESVFTWTALEQNLVNYLADSSAHSKPFDIKSIPVISKTKDRSELSRAKTIATEDMVTIAPAPAANGKAGMNGKESGDKPVDAASLYSKTFSNILALSKLGPIFKSSSPIELTESETEYVVSCIKHVLQNNVVFQFECRNTLSDSLLENILVDMKMETEDEEDILEQEFSIPIDILTFDSPKSVFVVYKRNPDACPTAYFSNTLKFMVKDCDPNTGEADGDGYDDEYLVEDMELTVGDYIIPSFVNSFDKAWSEIGDANEVVETYSLTNMANIQSAITTIIELFGGMPCENSEIISKERATTHTLLISGIFSGGIPVLSRCRMAFAASSGVTMEVTVRSSDANVSYKLANSVH